MKKCKKHIVTKKSPKTKARPVGQGGSGLSFAGVRDSIGGLFGRTNTLPGREAPTVICRPIDGEPRVLIEVLIQGSVRITHNDCCGMPAIMAHLRFPVFDKEGPPLPALWNRSRRPLLPSLDQPLSMKIVDPSQRLDVADPSQVTPSLAVVFLNIFICRISPWLTRRFSLRFRGFFPLFPS